MNINYYFLKIVNQDENLCYDWNDFQMETTANLIVGDIINFRNEKCNEDLIKDFNTNKFIVKQREFICDSDLENIGGVFNLYVKPFF